MNYAIVIEKRETGYGAYVPDLPGCVAVGATLSETTRLVREANEFHLEGLREDGIAIPEPSTVTSAWRSECRTKRFRRRRRAALVISWSSGPAR